MDYFRIQKGETTALCRYTILLVVLLLQMFSSQLYAENTGWVTREGQSIPNSDTVKSIDGFGGWLIVTPDIDWESKWDTSPDTTPTFTEASTVLYGEQLTILPFYINPKMNDASEINVLCDFKITRPDGSLSVNLKDQKCAAGKLEGHPRNVRLATLFLKFVGDKNDPPGTWTVAVDLVDKIRGTRIPLRTQFTLLKKLPDGKNEKDTDSNAILTLEAFSKFVQGYYLNPQPERIDSAITFISTSDMVRHQEAQNAVLMSFSCLFSQYDSEKKKPWVKRIRLLAEPAKSLLTAAINQSPQALLDMTDLSPAKNDRNWACFFATGESVYLNNIIDTLQYLDERENLNLFLTAASAEWSLSSNARNHTKVRQMLKAISPRADGALNKTPQVIREETITILKKQKQKGIWK